MNRRFVGVLIFAFVVATCGAWIIYRQLVSSGRASTGNAPVARIVLAAHNLEAGMVLSGDDVKLADWPGPIPEGASSRTQDFVGRGVVTEIYAKEPVSESRLAAKGAGGGLAVLIPEGMRAFAVRVNDVVGVSGFVTAGMRVDVVINGSPPGEDASLGTQAQTLLQNVEVLSAGHDFKKDAEGKPVASQVVNLLVTPAQAEKLSLAANETTVQLILRNPLDREVAPTPGASMAFLFHPNGVRPAHAAAKAVNPATPTPVAHEIETPVKKDAPLTMEIIMGTQKTEKKFGAGEGDK